MKKCNYCSKHLSESEFYFDKANNRLKSYCKHCQKQIVSKNRKKLGSGSWWQAKYCKSKNRARLRGIKYKLSLDEYKLIQNTVLCHYCEEKLYLVTMDRVDNNIGYIPSNIVASCMACNKLKGTLTKKQITNFYKKICI